MNQTQVYVINGMPYYVGQRRAPSSDKYQAQKASIIVASIFLESQHEGKPFIEGPVSMHITFFSLPPSNIKSNKRTSMAGLPHTSRPSLFPLLKFIESVSTGILYKDPAIICQIEVKKIYDMFPRTEFYFKKLN
jgi:Holliday junction resolvase RusA-like endonuclease